MLWSTWTKHKTCDGTTAMQEGMLSLYFPLSQLSVAEGAGRGAAVICGRREPSVYALHMERMVARQPPEHVARLVVVAANAARRASCAAHCQQLVYMLLFLDNGGGVHLEAC
jgi:hypothetical protein